MYTLLLPLRSGVMVEYRCCDAGNLVSVGSSADLLVCGGNKTPREPISDKQ